MSVNGAGQETRWIDWIEARERLAGGTGGRRFPVGIGDDAAVWTPRRGSSVVLTVDAQVEGVHFRRRWLSLTEIGARAVSASVSDLAAMAARPVAILASLVLAPRTTTRDFQELHRGISRAARRHGLCLLGGNLSAGPLAITITAIGEAPVQGIVRRSGARPGDDLWVTGSPGLARLGLLALTRGVSRRSPPGALQGALRAFVSPRPRLREALAIARELRPTAMIDLSDGLAQDLGRVLAASSRPGERELGAELDAAALAGLPGLAAAAARLGESAAATALRGGEDYELLFAAPSTRAAGRREEAFRRRFGLAVTRIGRVVAGSGLRFAGARGTSRVPGTTAWQHFGTAASGRGRRRRPQSSSLG